METTHKEREGDRMGKIGKIFAGAAIGVGAIAAAPFTGGGSLLGGAGLLGSLAGAGTIAAAVGAGTAGALVGAAADSLEKDEHIADIKRAKESAFKDGANEAKHLAAAEIKKYANFYLATTALSYFAARCDGSISEEEKLEIDYDLDAIRKNCDIADGVKNKMIEISQNENLTWDEVVSYLDKVGIDTLERLGEDVDEIIAASDGITSKEKKVKKDFDAYLADRKKGKNKFNDGIILYEGKEPEILEDMAEEEKEFEESDEEGYLFWDQVHDYMIYKS